MTSRLTEKPLANQGLEMRGITPTTRADMLFGSLDDVNLDKNASVALEA